MLKKSLFILVLLSVSLPAYAWQLQTRVATVGGGISVDSGAVQTSANGTVYENYTDSAAPVVVITADVGYKINRVTINGVIQPLPLSPATYTMGLNAYPGKTNQSVLAYFTGQTFPATASAGPGGSVYRAGTTQVKVNALKYYVFLPQAGKNVVDITGLPAGTNLTNYSGGAPVTLPAPVAVRVKATFNMPAEAVSINGVFVNLTASTDGPKTVLLGGEASLTASSSDTGATFVWTQTGGPGFPATPISGTAATLSFLPTVAGTYNFNLVAASGPDTATANTYIVATTDAVAAAESQCQPCHVSRNIGQTEFAEWTTSPHAADTVMCYDCHIGAASGGHPGETPTSFTCEGCHDTPHGIEYLDCLNCHDPHSTAGAGGDGACTLCHGYPPNTGAHLTHFGLDSAGGPYTDLQTLEARYPTATVDTAPAVYAFGCAGCHSVDSANHKNGSVDVYLYEAAVEPGSLKARSDASASYDPFDGTCSGVYCHSTGQETPVFQTTPAWTSTEELACNSCHGNPPAYPSGGEGTPTANNHVQIASDGWEWGHFQSTPGPWHSAYHGTQSVGGAYDASPLTCQSCHYETTDSANTGVSGFYYLDTSGFYVLEGSFSEDWYKERVLNCAYCHDPLNPNAVVNPQPAGTGQVLPLRHVNGKRDVVFDSRTELPQDITWLPAEPNRPTRPFWSSRYAKQSNYPEIEVWDNGTTVSWDLSDANYDPETKTCSSTKCHVTDTAPVWGRPLGNGQFYGECCQCHADKCYY